MEKIGFRSPLKFSRFKLAGFEAANLTPTASLPSLWPSSSLPLPFGSHRLLHSSQPPSCPCPTPFFNASLSFGTHGGLDYQREQTTRVFSAPAKQRHYSKMFSEEFDIYCFKKYPGSHHEEESRLLLDFLILIFLVGYSNLISIWRNTILFSVLRTAEGLNFYLWTSWTEPFH